MHRNTSNTRKDQEEEDYVTASYCRHRAALSFRCNFMQFHKTQFMDQIFKPHFHMTKDILSVIFKDTEIFSNLWLRLLSRNEFNWILNDCEILSRRVDFLWEMIEESSKWIFLKKNQFFHIGCYVYQSSLFCSRLFPFSYSFTKYMSMCTWDIWHHMS